MVLIFITKNIMKKKVIYLNAKTGKEVQYGEQISFKESGKFENGYSFYSETSLPVINATIPDLIEKGILVQKEVEIKEEEQQNKEQHEMTVDEKLDILIGAVHNLIKEQELLKKNIVLQSKILNRLTEEVEEDYE